MTKIWTTPGGRNPRVATRNLGRHFITASIIALGAVVAAGTIGRTTYLPHTSLAARVVAADSSARKVMNPLAMAASAVRRNGLDAGIEHPTIDHWVARLSTTMADGMARSLGRMTKYDDMIGEKLAATQLPPELIY